MATTLLETYKQKISHLELHPGAGGCFEVKVDGNLIFSKLESERFPEHDEILEAIESKDYERGLAVLEKNRLTTYNDFIDRLMEDRGSEDPVVVK